MLHLLKRVLTETNSSHATRKYLVEINTYGKWHKERTQTKYRHHYESHNHKEALSLLLPIFFVEIQLQGRNLKNMKVKSTFLLL